MLKRILSKSAEITTTILLGAMIFVLLLQIIFRYVLNSPLTWSEELARYLYVWVTFMGAGYCVYKHMHIEMTMFFDMLPPAVQKVLQVLVNLFSAACYAYIIPAGIRFAISQNRIPSVSLPIKMSLLWAAIPLGCSLLVISLLIETYYLIRGWYPAASRDGR